MKIQKLKLEEDLRNATKEKKRLADSERILLNTFDTLKKYYDGIGNDKNPEELLLYKCKDCAYEANTEEALKTHTRNMHMDRDARDNQPRNEERRNGGGRNRNRMNEERRQDDERSHQRRYEERRQDDGRSHQRRNEERRQDDGRSYQRRNEERSNFGRNNQNGRDQNNGRGGQYQRKIYCIYWNRGKCTSGSQCRFSHEESPECIYKNRCNRKEVCRFFHSDMYRRNDDHFLGQRQNTLAQS